MKYALLFSLLAFTHLTAAADNEKGFFLGGGAAATVNDDCDTCDTSGHVIEVGYNFNKVFGWDAKTSDTSFDNFEGEMDIDYFGFNIGNTFNSSWVRLYGKIGYADVTHLEPFEGEEDKESDSNMAYGIGVVFTPFDHQRGIYIKIESMATKYYDADVGAGQIGIGFHF